MGYLTLFLIILLSCCSAQQCTQEDKIKLRTPPVLCTFANIMEECGRVSWLPGRFEACFTQKTGSTFECSKCFLANIKCTLDNCSGSDCIGNPTGQKCLECSEKFCVPSLLTCTGIPKSELPPAQPPPCCPNNCQVVS